MTQTIDERARELLAKHASATGCEEFTGLVTVPLALAALTEALTRIGVLEGALINIGEVDDDGFTSDGHERCAEHARGVLTKGINNA